MKSTISFCLFSAYLLIACDQAVRRPNEIGSLAGCYQAFNEGVDSQVCFTAQGLFVQRIYTEGELSIHQGEWVRDSMTNGGKVVVSMDLNSLLYVDLSGGIQEITGLTVYPRAVGYSGEIIFETGGMGVHIDLVYKKTKQDSRP